MSTKLKRIAFILGLILVPVTLSYCLNVYPKASLYVVLAISLVGIIVALWNFSGMVFEDDKK